MAQQAHAVSMTSTHKHRAALLYNASVLYINAISGGWTVDVFGDDNVDDLIYHAFHATEQDALDDMASWKQWDDDDLHWERVKQEEDNDAANTQGR